MAGKKGEERGEEGKEEDKEEGKLTPTPPSQSRHMEGSEALIFKDYAHAIFLRRLWTVLVSLGWR